MSTKKMIHCRVCKKLFEPCVTCQAHNDIFRWRNFACSRECAEKYISETIAYRNSLKEDKYANSVNYVASSKVESNVIGSNMIKRKYSKKKSVNNAEIINKEREQID